MFGLTGKDIGKLLIDGVTHALFWGLLTYYVRKGWNSANFGDARKASMEKQLAGEGNLARFYSDAFYGSIASFLLVIFRTLARNRLYKVLA